MLIECYSQNIDGYRYTHQTIFVHAEFLTFTETCKQLSRRVLMSLFRAHHHTPYHPPLTTHPLPHPLTSPLTWRKTRRFAVCVAVLNGSLSAKSLHSHGSPRLQPISTAPSTRPAASTSNSTGWVADEGVSRLLVGDPLACHLGLQPLKAPIIRPAV